MAYYKWTDVEEGRGKSALRRVLYHCFAGVTVLFLTLMVASGILDVSDMHHRRFVFEVCTMGAHNAVIYNYTIATISLLAAGAICYSWLRQRKTVTMLICAFTYPLIAFCISFAEFLLSEHCC